MSFRLILVSGNQERIINIEKDSAYLGRASDNDVEIEDINSSRKHCRIVRQKNGLYAVEDLNSRNGTFVNGVLVNKKVLQPGDKIEIGQTTLFFEKRKNIEAEETAHLPAIMDSTQEMESSMLPKGDGENQEEQLQDLQQEVKDLYKLLQINQALSREQNSKKLLELIMDQAIEVSGAERGFIILCQEDRLEVQCSRNLDQEFVKKSKFKISSSIVQQVLESNQPVLTNDAQNDNRFTGIFSVQGLKLRSVLCVPLRDEEKSIGVLYLDNRFERGVFNRYHLRLIQAFADQAAIALRIAWLLEEAKKREEDLKKSQETIMELNKKLQKELEKQKLRYASAIRKASSPPTKKRPKLKHDYSSIITQSPKMYEIFKVLDKVCNSNVPVLIQGESGTGKELIARALHFNSKRKKKEFVSENCGAIPQTLMESEFFGYEKGAFTGADRRKLGLFEVANGGTLFLDEISEMDPDMQTKLLRVLQEGEIRRVGGKETIKVDVRIISACNKDLAEEVKKNHFREDLFYRLNVITIQLPPLRERKEDIPLLVDYFLTKNAKKMGKPKKSVSQEAMDILLDYDWPGNVRELENEIERACALSKDMITPDILSPTLLSGERVRDEGSKTYQGTLKEILQKEMEEVERRVILQTLERCKWVKSKAAEALGISRPTLDMKMEKYEIHRSV